jgi:hypothetical protein
MLTVAIDVAQGTMIRTTRAAILASAIYPVTTWDARGL